MEEEGLNIIGGDLLSVYGHAYESNGLFFVPAHLRLDNTVLVTPPYQWNLGTMNNAILLNGVRSAFRIAPLIYENGARLSMLVVSPTLGRGIPLMIESDDDGYSFEKYHYFRILKEKELMEEYREHVIPAFLDLIERAHASATEPWSEMMTFYFPRISWGFDGNLAWEVLEEGYEGEWPDDLYPWEPVPCVKAMETIQASYEDRWWEFRLENPSGWNLEERWPPENHLRCPACLGSGMILALGIAACSACDKKGMIQAPWSQDER